MNVNSLYRNVEKPRDPQSTALLKGNLNLSTINSENSYPLSESKLL